MLGNTYFFFLAALLQFNIVIYAQGYFAASPTQKNSYLQAAIAIGIGLGSFAAGYLSGDKIEYGLIPFGSVGIDRLRRAARLAGTVIRPFAAVARVVGIFRRFFHRAHLGVAATSARTRKTKGGVLRRRKFAFIRRHFSRRRAFIYLMATVAHLSPPAKFFC